MKVKKRWTLERVKDLIRTIQSEINITYMPTTNIIKKYASGAYELLRRTNTSLEDLAEDMGLEAKEDYLKRKQLEKIDMSLIEFEYDEETIKKLSKLKYIKEHIEIDKEMDIRVRFNRQGRDTYKRKHGRVVSKTGNVFVVDHGHYKEAYRYADLLTKDLVIRC